jgi:energy-coupling factor transport system permease protein
MLGVILIIILKIPFAVLKKGWLPIGLFLIFTFISNMFFSHGKILYNIGTIMITEEGIHIASIRTLRIFLMVMGAKIITATTSLDVLVESLASVLRPLEKIRLPVNELFSIMGLTLQCFPKLKDYLSENYRNYKKNNLPLPPFTKGGMVGFFKKTMIISSFLLPMFIQSMQSPEIFFRDKMDDRKQV